MWRGRSTRRVGDRWLMWAPPAGFEPATPGTGVRQSLCPLGASGRIRTCDTWYRSSAEPLSLERLRQDSNLRHLVPETSALSPELRRPVGARRRLPADIPAKETEGRRYAGAVNPAQLSSTVVEALAALVDDGRLTLPDGVPTEVTVERPRQKGHGDYATNVALQLGKKALVDGAGTNPR